MNDQGYAAHEIDDAAAGNEAYEQRFLEALEDSRRDFDEGRYCMSRDEMLEAVAEKRAFSSESADHFLEVEDFRTSEGRAEY